MGRFERQIKRSFTNVSTDMVCRLRKYGWRFLRLLHVHTKRRPSFIPSACTEAYNRTSNTETRSFSLYGDTTVCIQRQQHGITRQNNGLESGRDCTAELGEISLAQQIKGLHSRNIEMAQSSAYIRIDYVVVYIAEQSSSETGRFLTA